MADSLGIDRGRLNDLILGRRRPTMGEVGALTGRRPSTLAQYEDASGNRHSFYTGRGMSYERLIEAEVLVEMADEQADVNHYDDFEQWVGLINRYPKHPTMTRIYPTRKRFTDTVRDMRVPKRQ